MACFSKKELEWKGIAFYQIFLVIISIFAFAFLISEISMVSGQSESFADKVLASQSKSGLDASHDFFSGTDYSTPVPRSASTIIQPTKTTSSFNIEQIRREAAQTQEVVSPKSGFFAGSQVVLGHLFKGITYALLVAGAIQLVGGLVGADKDLTNAASIAAASGIIAGKLTYGIAAAKIGGTITYTTGEGLGSGWLGTGLTGAGFSATLIGIAVAAAVFALTYKKETQKIVQFQCLVWEAPLGGEKCEECNKNKLMPCSEYRCKSLGQACELVNKGSVEEKCVWVNPQDVNAPTITPLARVLTEGHKYTSHSTLPPSLGTEIVKGSGECIKAFTPLVFGFSNNEPARCKIDHEHKNSFDEMEFFAGNNNFLVEEHTQFMSLPSPDAINVEGPVIESNGIYDFFVRCQDANGNVNEQEFVFSFCVDPSPDTTPPIIVSTSIKSGSAVAFGSDEVSFSLFVNEPSECKWSIQNKGFDTMENKMQCATSVFEQNAQQLYECSTTLTGIKDRDENKFYFRCKDQPKKPENEKNVNVQSLEILLRGTQELNIIDVNPESNSTIFGNTGIVKVDLELETSNGADEGKAICYFSPSGEEGSYVVFFETDSFEHKQTLSLNEGKYEYHFRCIDAGGNSDTVKTEFNVFIDNIAPEITRVYRELDALKAISDEDAECVYSLNSCNFIFEEGLKMIYSNPSIKTSHFAEWKPNLVYHIKCKDTYGNQPSPNECSLIASATNVK